MADEKSTPIRKKAKGFHISTDIDFEIRSPKARAALVSVLAVLLVVFCGYHVSSGIVNRADDFITKTAVKYTHRQTIQADAFILREEVMINGTGNGEVVALAQDGTKVSGNDTVAHVYASTAEAQSYYQLQEVLEDIEYYEAIQQTSVTNALPDISAYDKKVQQSIFALLQDLSAADATVIPGHADDVRAALAKRSIAVGMQVDVSPKLSALYARRNELINAMHNYTTVQAQRAGYYVHAADGFESSTGVYNALPVSLSGNLSQAVKSIDPVIADSLMRLQPQPANAPYGKLITGFEWYIVCNAETILVADLQVGMSLLVSFADSSASPVEAEIVALNADGYGHTAMVLSATAMDGKYAQLRKAGIVIQTDAYSGLRVDNTAIRTVDGEKGVYVRLGNVITFRKIEVLYAGSEFSVAAADSGTGYLKPYDEIITEGTDLYDGKLVK